MVAPVILTPGESRPELKAIAFDAFPVFDPRPVFKAVIDIFPEKGKQLSELWQSKQFSYQWLRVLGNRYKNFWEVTKDALDFAVAQCGLTLSTTGKEVIMDKYKTITTWPDVIPALRALKEEKLRLVFLSNMTAEMLDQGIKNSNTKDFFEQAISTDEKQTYKPGRTAYQLGVDKLNLKKEEILFVAFAGWDVAGAKWFGYPSFWVNRFNLPADHLDAIPDGSGSSLDDLADFVKSYNKKTNRQ